MMVLNILGLAIALMLGIGLGLPLAFVLIVLVCRRFDLAIPLDEIPDTPQEEPFHVVSEWTYEVEPCRKKPKKVKVKRPWSKDHDCCEVCGTTSRPCHGHGLCARCYSREYVRPSRRK